ncbi:glutaredoxin family protein [Synergistes jonesii]|uniref:Glutaredoxin n=1 Tax=Synergistes jonesii TaxID=2754 RepID=A0A073IQB5_9BACT|nr:thioredoxin family protein [Synergistes jonesii]KEJ91944.1 glutaredoxin [Synergistes jonesii]OFB61896.1 glutaredoxin [Synergistes jonesii]OFB62225.1 glutaredoxin [Synergistes jonesii]OFB62953.1 glutaredoxin [Synergistes jonesii]OFB67459.1 glutaredoxin [Synergistes jonesii]
MKEVKMFMFEGCPHCKKALEIKAALLEARPEYKKVPFVMIDEKKEPETADKYDYYYVPTFYVGDDKIAEGVPSEEGVAKVFELAYEE